MTKIKMVNFGCVLVMFLAWTDFHLELLNKLIAGRGNVMGR